MLIRAVIVRTLSTPEHKMPPTAVLAGVSRTCLCVASQQAVLRDNLLRLTFEQSCRPKVPQALFSFLNTMTRHGLLHCPQFICTQMFVTVAL